ncbi:MAG: hypothetical protein WAL90_19720 [Desulfobacterales bacterium]
MLFIGHFSFDALTENESERHGYFTCLVDSGDVDRATDAFKSLITEMKAENELFAAVAAVYIEDIFEIEKVPQKAVMLRLQSSAGEFPESVSRSLPFATQTGITAYGWAPDERKIRAAEEDEVLEMEPFISFT